MIAYPRFLNGTRAIRSCALAGVMVCFWYIDSCSIVSIRFFSTAGMVSTWFVDGKGKPSAQASAYGSNARSPITIVKWNSNGRRLVTGDEVGFWCRSLKLFLEVFTDDLFTERSCVSLGSRFTWFSHIIKTVQEKQQNLRLGILLVAQRADWG